MSEFFQMFLGITVTNMDDIHDEIKKLTKFYKLLFSSKTPIIPPIFHNIKHQVKTFKTLLSLVLYLYETWHLTMIKELN